MLMSGSALFRSSLVTMVMNKAIENALAYGTQVKLNKNRMFTRYGTYLQTYFDYSFESVTENDILWSSSYGLVKDTLTNGPYHM